MRMLISVRDVQEALAAAQGGADFIDLKEPRDGALGGLPPAVIREVVGALRTHSPRVPISATIGDLPMRELSQVLSRVAAVGACGVDYVKVGIERDVGAPLVLDALAGCGWPVVPVFIADRGLDDGLIERACEALPAFPAIMVDTADKRTGSLFDLMLPAELRQFVDRARVHGILVGVAGALRASQIDLLAALQPDFAGFRSAVCEGDRGSRLDTNRVRDLSLRMKAAGSSPQVVRNDTVVPQQ